jgi:hypothetical protein
MSLGTRDDADLSALFDQVPSLAGSPRAMTELPGGLTNRNFKITTPNGTFVARVASGGSELLAIDPEKTYLVVEHEYPPARIQDRERLKPILAGSLAFTRAIDEAAAAMYALQHEVLASAGLAVQGIGREPYRS